MKARWERVNPAKFEIDRKPHVALSMLHVRVSSTADRVLLENPICPFDNCLMINYRTVFEKSPNKIYSTLICLIIREKNVHLLLHFSDEHMGCVNSFPL